MAANTTPVFVLVPYVNWGRATVANTGRDGSGTIITIATGTTDGLRINVVKFKHEVTSLAGMYRIFISINAGVTWRLLDEIVVDAITVGAATAAFQSTWTPPGGFIVLGASVLLGFAPEKAEACVATAIGGTYS